MELKAVENLYEELLLAAIATGAIPLDDPRAKLTQFGTHDLLVQTGRGNNRFDLAVFMFLRSRLVSFDDEELCLLWKAIQAYRDRQSYDPNQSVWKSLATLPGLAWRAIREHFNPPTLPPDPLQDTQEEIETFLEKVWLSEAELEEDGGAYALVDTCALVIGSVPPLRVRAELILLSNAAEITQPDTAYAVLAGYHRAGIALPPAIAARLMAIFCDPGLFMVSDLVYIADDYPEQKSLLMNAFAIRAAKATMGELLIWDKRFRNEEPSWAIETIDKEIRNPTRRDQLLFFLSLASVETPTPPPTA